MSEETPHTDGIPVPESDDQSCSSGAAYRDGIERMESFDVCPHSFPVKILQLAKAGFFYGPREDFIFSVMCFGCSKNVNIWRNGDVPSHQRFHEVGCSFVKQTDGSQGDPNRKLPSNKPKQSGISPQYPHETSGAHLISKNEDLSPSTHDFAEKVQLSECVFMFSNMTLCQQGNVYEGEMTSTSDPLPCAIKFARQSEQNLREERVLRKLGSHRHIISLFNSGTFDDGLLSHHFLVLEKCHELNLCQYLSSSKESVPVYDVNWRMNFSKQLLDGIEYIHSKLIIHKDLKPSNVLLSYDDLSTIKIADFGSSQEVDSASSAIYCPYMFGTMGFRPPESFGGSYSSLKSDIFSLGVVLYFLLSNGKSPFGQELELWDHNIQNGIIEFQQLPLPNPKSTEHLLQCMLSLDRLHRPSIHEVKGHPCWIGTEDACEFVYFCEEELQGEIPKEEAAEEEDEELIENERKLVAAMETSHQDNDAEKNITANTIGQLSIQDRAKVLTRRAGEISNEDVCLHFPENALKDVAVVRLQLDVPRIDDGIMKELLLISKVLRISSGIELQNPVQIAVTTWLHNESNNGTPAIIFYRKEDTDIWQLDQNVIVGLDGKAIFWTTKLGAYMVMARENILRKKYFEVQSCLFESRGKNKVSNRLVMDFNMRRKEMEKQMSEKQFRHICSQDLTIKVKLGDEIKVEIRDVKGDKDYESPPPKTARITKELFYGKGHDEQEFNLPKTSNELIEFSYRITVLRDGEILDVINRERANLEWVFISPTIKFHRNKPLCHSAEVYYAEQDLTGYSRKLAVKLVKKTERSAREAGFLAKLESHRNIVSIYDYGNCKNYPLPHIFIAMELCRQNLHDYIGENPFSLPKASSFFHQTSSAISFIHDKRIAHRDLKPSNILIALDGDTIKVSDFGVSKDISPPSTYSYLEAFKAPETYKTTTKHDSMYKADIFSLGINGYYIYTHGKHPFGPNDYEWPGNIVGNKHRSLSHIPLFPQYSSHKRPQLIKLLKHMVQYDPRDRPTAQEVLDNVFFHENTPESEDEQNSLQRQGAKTESKKKDGKSSN